jgi:hypothetical protein
VTHLRVFAQAARVQPRLKHAVLDEDKVYEVLRQSGKQPGATA